MTISFGARLRRQREERHITLAEIASITKIQASLFEGLERDDVSRWPAGIFGRSFVRAYADVIGLDPEAVCREFVERYPERGALALKPGHPLAPVPAGASQSRSEGDPGSAPALRLTLADPPTPIGTARLLHMAGWWRALACDGGTPILIALAAFVIFERFWMPLALTACAYFLGGLIVFGTTPGAWLLTPHSRVRVGGRSTTPDADSGMYQPVDMGSTRARA